MKCNQCGGGTRLRVIGYKDAVGYVYECLECGDFDYSEIATYLRYLANNEQQRRTELREHEE